MREISQERLIKDTKRVLENPFWIPDLVSGKGYRRLHDDHDGTREGEIEVIFDSQGDAWFMTDKHQGVPLRFREALGGGRSQRVRNALMILAWAIKLDNRDHPDPEPIQQDLTLSQTIVSPKIKICDSCASQPSGIHTSCSLRDCECPNCDELPF